MEIKQLNAQLAISGSKQKRWLPEKSMKGLLRLIFLRKDTVDLQTPY
jgi:hypothetical protein